MMDVYIPFIIFYGLVRMSQGEPQLLFANRKDIRLVSATDTNPNVSVIVEDLDDAAGVDFIYSIGYVFWTDINLEVIQRAVIGRVPETKIEIVNTGLISPDGLACDWVGNKLYWSDSDNFRIEVSNLDGSDRKVLYWQNLGRPRAIALNPYDGFMYWTDWGEVPKIERAGMDGTSSTRTVIVDNNIYWPNGLTIDYDEKKIYWTDAKHGYIHKCDYDGSHREEVIKKDFSHLFSITLFKENLFWTDWKTKAIHTCNKLTGQGYKTILKDIHSPMNIQVFDAERQVDVPHPCDTDNGGCSHLCLLSPIRPNFKCACPTGVRLLDDQKNCANGFEEMLLIARRTDLRIISLDTPDFTQIELQLKDIKHAISIDYDPVDGYVYWTDDSVKSIRRAFLNGTGQEVVIDTELDQTDGIALDIVGRNMYWTDTGTDRIEVSRLNGSYRKILISENLDEPRGISLDTKRGYMFWTDWGKVPKIEKAYLDGTNRQVVINKLIGWPNSIVVDSHENKIYWCDAKMNTIEAADLDGSNRVTLVRNLPHAFGLSLLGDNLYWTEWQMRQIESVNKRTGKNRTVIGYQTPDLMGLKAVSSKKTEEWNSCADNNGLCSHLCLYTPEGPQCACPSGLGPDHTGRKCTDFGAVLLYISEGKLNRLSLTTSLKSPITFKGLDGATCLDFDGRENMIYWVDGQLPSINRAFLNGSSYEKIVEFGLTESTCIAVDWLSRNIYWTIQTRIEVSKLDGSSRRILVWKDLTQVKDLTVDPTNGYMYWTDWAKRPKLERAWLDGSHREVLLDENNLLYGLTIDYGEKRLYWSDHTHQRLVSSDMQGGNHTIIVDTDIQRPMALTLYEDFLYWIDRKKMTIEKADKTTGGNRTLVQEHVDKVMDLLVFHHSRQSGSNGCVGNTGQCSHLCLALPDSHNKTKQFKCACPTHYVSSDDGKSCTPPNSFLLYFQKTTLKRLVVSDNDSEEGPDEGLPINELRNLKALEYDPVEGYVYWISGKSKAIRKSKLDGTDNQNVIKTTGIRPFDLAIDPFSRVLFYSCERNNVINFTRIDEKKKSGVVVQGEDLKPRYLALNPQTGHMFWTNECFIRRTLFDGTDTVDVIRSVFKPGPITVDPVMRKIFWSNPEKKMIEYADLNGDNRKQLLTGRTNNNIQTISGLSVMDEYLYWTDSKKGVIGRINKNSGRNLTFVQRSVPKLRGIHAVVPLDPADIKQHPCSSNNGNCTHLCFTKIENKAQCSCPDNMVLMSDERSCAEKTRCAPGQFACKSGIECIPMQWYCDGTSECFDSSDEEGCSLCDDGEYMCRDGKCIPVSHVCDGTFQCADGEDEDDCWRKESQTTSLDSKKYMNSLKWWSNWPIRPFLLYSQMTEISRLVVHDYDSAVAPDVVLPIQFSNPKALDFDSTEGYIYWINGKDKTIERSKMNGTEVQTIVSKGGIQPFDIAYDLFSRVLFYSCQRNNVINFVRDHEKIEGTIIHGYCAEPRYLALYSPTGYIFWTDKHVIRRALFDGTEAVDIFRSRSSRVGPITIDHGTRMIYWTDLEHNLIESGNFFGGVRKLLHGGKSNKVIQSIVGIAVLDNYLYWADSYKQMIGRIDKTTGRNVTFVQGRVPDLSGIQTAVSMDPWEIKKHPCSKDNGNCSHLCFLERKKGVRCSCPHDLMLLSDGKSCSVATEQ